MELSLQGSSHQPARERRAVATLRARSIPHRTMGAAILKRTKWNAGPGVRARGGRGRGRPRLLRKWTASGLSPSPGAVVGAVRAGTTWLRCFGPWKGCGRRVLRCNPGWRAQAPPAAAALSEVPASSRCGDREGGREGSVRPQQHLSLEKARATFPSDCTCVQPRLLGTPVGAWKTKGS